MTTTPKGTLLLGAVRRNFELLVELEKSTPHDAVEIVAAMIDHIRAWKPQLLLAAQREEVSGG